MLKYKIVELMQYAYYAVKDWGNLITCFVRWQMLVPTKGNPLD